MHFLCDTISFQTISIFGIIFAHCINKFRKNFFTINISNFTTKLKIYYVKSTKNLCFKILFNKFHLCSQVRSVKWREAGYWLRQQATSSDRSADGPQLTDLDAWALDGFLGSARGPSACMPKLPITAFALKSLSISIYLSIRLQLQTHTTWILTRFKIVTCCKSPLVGSHTKQHTIFVSNNHATSWMCIVYCATQDDWSKDLLYRKSRLAGLHFVWQTVIP